jgi:hypothetical protein
MKRLLALQAATIGVALVGLTGIASASAPTTPNGYAGAWNMLKDSTMLSGPMAHDNANGNAGMCRAVLVSSGVGC